ncbi:hypothetical protein LMCDFJHI_00790 [Aeromonas salmonicida]
MSYQHPWCARLLTSLPEDQIKSAVLADEPRWDYVETELVKLGSLAHSQVDLNAVAEACLGLLESRTKDMRVLAQLLRCLQHPAKATPLGPRSVCWSPGSGPTGCKPGPVIPARNNG